MTSLDRLSEGYEPRWDLDYEVGRQGELWVQDIADSLRSDAREVKVDERFADTGNVYVEYECRYRGQYRPSGIAITEAPVWVFVLQSEGLALVVSTDLLRGVSREGYRAGRVAECSRGSYPTRGVLVPVARLISEVRREGRDAA